jgi:hypothetical protein
MIIDVGELVRFYMREGEEPVAGIVLKVWEDNTYGLQIFGMEGSSMVHAAMAIQVEPVYPRRERIPQSDSYPDSISTPMVYSRSSEANEDQAFVESTSQPESEPEPEPSELVTVRQSKAKPKSRWP